jgi:hypothetical protein
MKLTRHVKVVHHFLWKEFYIFTFVVQQMAGSGVDNKGLVPCRARICLFISMSGQTVSGTSTFFRGSKAGGM